MGQVIRPPSGHLTKRGHADEGNTMPVEREGPLHTWSVLLTKAHASQRSWMLERGREGLAVTFVKGEHVQQ